MESLQQKQPLAGRDGAGSERTGSPRGQARKKGQPKRGSTKKSEGDSIPTTDSAEEVQDSTGGMGDGVGVPTGSEEKKTIRRPEMGKPEPKKRRFAPRPCHACKEIREKNPKAKNENYSEVYGTRHSEIGTSRYCRCRFCGNTWVQLENVPNQSPRS